MKKAPALLLILCAPALFAQARRASIASPANSALDRPASATSPNAAAGEGKAGDHHADGKDTPKDQIFTTHGTANIGGQAVSYTANAGTMVMKDEEGNAIASIFFVAYTKDGADPAKRPVTYTFNGGPGSSSVWLHMGAFGPKRVAYADDAGHAAAPPYRLVDNEDSILDVTDLVFIDPVSTGFSRAIPYKDSGRFHGVEADVQSVGESSGSGRRGTTAGRRRSSWLARAMARRARRACPAGCRDRAVTSTASS
jgi:carboxypeptidase C (cathepsin A)